MDDYGLVLTGELRAVTERYYRNDDGEKFAQAVVVLYTGRDRSLDEVNVRKDDIGLVRGLEARRGEVVSLRVSVGNYRRLWLEEVR